MLNLQICHEYLRANVVYEPTWLRANVRKACQFPIFTYQYPNKRAACDTACQCFKLDVPTCQKACQFFKHSSCEMLRGNFYTLLLHKNFSILLDIIVMHIICICIVHINCIILHSYTSYHINPDKAGLFEDSFSGKGGQFEPPFIFQEELIQYQRNLIQLLNNLFKVC